MTPDDAARLLAACAAFDNRQPSEIAMRAWAKSLQDMPLDDDAFAAVARFYGTPPEKAGERLWIQPHDVRTHRKIIRSERLANYVYEPPPGDDTNYIERRRQHLREVASGIRPAATEAPALTGGPHPNVSHVIAGVGRTIPEDDPEVAAVKRPGPFGRECPRCQAPIGRPCRTPGGRERAPHPSRQPSAPVADIEAEQREIERRREVSRRRLAEIPDPSVIEPQDGFTPHPIETEGA